MKIALTLFSPEDKPMLVMDFDDYVDLRDYWKPRRKNLPKYEVRRVDAGELPGMRAACVGLTPKVGAGWRTVDRDELIEEGDQWWASAAGKWENTRCTGNHPAPTTVYRRRYAGDGYRFLMPGEVIRHGDEYLLDGGKWIPTALLGATVGKFRGPDPNDGLTYRRPTGVGNPPAGFRILRAEEKVSEGDLYFSGRQWTPVSQAGYYVGGGAGYFATPTTPTTNQ